jgi:hypothetical protein
MKKDVDLLGRLAASRSPLETSQLYADHWRNMVGDYWKEFGTIVTLSQSVTGSVMRTPAKESLPIR